MYVCMYVCEKITQKWRFLPVFNQGLKTLQLSARDLHITSANETVSKLVDSISLLISCLVTKMVDEQFVLEMDLKREFWCDG